MSISGVDVATLSVACLCVLCVLLRHARVRIPPTDPTPFFDGLVS